LINLELYLLSLCCLITAGFKLFSRFYPGLLTPTSHYMHILLFPCCSISDRLMKSLLWSCRGSLIDFPIVVSIVYCISTSQCTATTVATVGDYFYTLYLLIDSQVRTCFHFICISYMALLI
jgi:hypothetical protein